MYREVACCGPLDMNRSKDLFPRDLFQSLMRRSYFVLTHEEERELRGISKDGNRDKSEGIDQDKVRGSSINLGGIATIRPASVLIPRVQYSDRKRREIKPLGTATGDFDCCRRL